MDSLARFTITQSTISGNATGADGGGLFTLGDVTVAHSTIAENRSNTDAITGTGGGVQHYPGAGDLTLDHTIVAGNVASVYSTPSDVGGTISASFSLIGDTSGATISGSNILIDDVNGVDALPFVG